MELGGVDPPDLDRRRESHAVLAPRDAHSLRARSHGSRVRSVRSRGRSHTLLSQATLGQSRAHGPRYNRIIRVNEIEMRARRDAVEEPELPGVLQADRRRHSDPPERHLDRAEVPAPVVDNGDHKLAFVEGKIPVIRRFRRVASATARPTALNTASVMWCRL